jgi:hypothetical protein
LRQKGTRAKSPDHQCEKQRFKSLPPEVVRNTNIRSIWS